MADPSTATPDVIVICGPTGIGKTPLAIEIATVFGGEIISADSMQIYRYMDIGTAKPTAVEQASVFHHMIDRVDPDEAFDAARYSKSAREVIVGLHGRGVLPVVAGGTGLYIKALLHGLFPANPADPKLRISLKTEASRGGSGLLYDRLCRCDPETASKIHPNDTYRIVRALEIYEGTGKAMSSHRNGHRFAETPFHALKIGLHMERQALYDRIDRRVDAMIGAGLVEEAKGLLGRGYSEDLKSMQSIGYRHMVDFIRGRMSWEESVRTMKRDTRRYAKRQMTWFSADPDLIWVASDRIGEIKRLIADFLNRPRQTPA